MSRVDYKITRLQPADKIPFELLLLADETIDAIEKYIYQSDVYVTHVNGESRPIAAFALYRISDAVIEIKNIAVAGDWQSKGIGSSLITEIMNIAFLENYKNIIVGTTDCGYRQINFYERNGFVKYDLRKNFFIDNYPRPIFENGVLLRDMVLLKLKL